MLLLKKRYRKQGRARAVRTHYPLGRMEITASKRGNVSEPTRIFLFIMVQNNVAKLPRFRIEHSSFVKYVTKAAMDSFIGFKQRVNCAPSPFWASGVAQRLLLGQPK